MALCIEYSSRRRPGLRRQTLGIVHLSGFRDLSELVGLCGVASYEQLWGGILV